MDSWFHIIEWLGVNDVKNLSQCNGFFNSICHELLKKLRSRHEFFLHHIAPDPVFIDIERLAATRGLEVNKGPWALQSGCKDTILLHRRSKSIKLVAIWSPTPSDIIISSIGLDICGPIKTEHMFIICWKRSMTREVIIEMTTGPWREKVFYASIVTVYANSGNGTRKNCRDFETWVK